MSIKDISISERQAECRYWLVYNYKSRDADVILWSDNLQNILNAWIKKTCDALTDEGKAPYGLACNLAAF